MSPRIRHVCASAVAACLLLVTPAPSAPTAPGAPGFTLVPRPLREGEPLRFVVPADLREKPDRASGSLSSHLPGEKLRAAGLVVHEDEEWVVTDEGHFVEAARVDRLPEEISGDLVPGREGMAGGRVLPWDYEPTDLVAVPDSLKAADYEWRAMTLRSGALEAFRELRAAARREGFELGILSAHRSAGYQRKLYERALGRNPVQRTTAAPGRSEHQLGTTADIGVKGVRPFTTALAESAAGLWISENAAAFGIVLSYSLTRHRARGTAFEPWHLRWVGGAVENEELW